MTATLPAKAVLPKVRRISFPFGDPEPIKKYYADDNIVMSHLFAMLSYSFPPGEEVFIRSVRRYSHLITDPILKKRVAAFIGQEAVHGLQHRELNEKLVALGYPFKELLEKSSKFWEAFDKVLDEEFPRERFRLYKLTQLAGTALGEHFTALAAERIFRSDELQSLMSDQSIKDLILWHAFEELEHKAVAFDVYRSIGGPEWLRVLMVRVSGPLLVPVFTVLVLGTIFVTDSYARRRPIKVFKDGIKLLRSPLVKGLRKDIALFGRRGFHPDDIDTTPLLDRWGSELFGEHGSLVSHLK